MHQLCWVCRLDGQQSSCIEIGEGLFDELEIALVKQLLVCGVQVRHRFFIEVVQVYCLLEDLDVFLLLILISLLSKFSFIELALPCCDLALVELLLSLPVAPVLNAPDLLKSKCLIVDEVHV